MCISFLSAAVVRLCIIRIGTVGGRRVVLMGERKRPFVPLQTSVNVQTNPSRTRIYVRQAKFFSRLSNGAGLVEVMSLCVGKSYLNVK